MPRAGDCNGALPTAAAAPPPPNPAALPAPRPTRTPEIKVVMLGNGGVGKSSMIRRFCKGVFTDEYKKTIGVDFLEKSQFVDALGEEVRFMLWDTGGEGVGAQHAAMRCGCWRRVC